jgi:cyclomaltodextrinase
MPIDTPDWVRDAVFYQIFPDRFASSATVAKPGPLEPWDAPATNHGFKGGDLVGIAERLDDLVELGVTALYLTPIVTSAANHRYHAYDYLRVDPLLGGDPALRILLDGAHERRMRVILDGVFNHCGRGFWPFHHVVENGASSPYRNWFHLDGAVLAGQRQVDPYPDRGGRHRADEARGYRAWWNLPALPKLNTDEPAVREYLLGVAEHWLRFGADGWRMDVPQEIDDPSFWRAFRRRCRSVDPESYLVGEIWDEAPEWLRGDRFDALMNYPLATSILGFVGGESLDVELVLRHDTYRRMIDLLDGPAFAERLERLMTNYDPDVVAVQLNLLGSHDTPRALSVLGRDESALRHAMLLQATLPGAPCIYYGDEIGMEGGLDPDNRRAYPAGPAPGDRVLRTFVRSLLEARRTHVALRRGTVTVAGVGDRAIAMIREAEGHLAVVAVNPGRNPTRLRILVPDGRPLRAAAILDLPAGSVGRDDDEVGGEANALVVELPSSGALVLVDD